MKSSAMRREPALGPDPAPQLRFPHISHSALIPAGLIGAARDAGKFLNRMGSKTPVALYVLSYIVQPAECLRRTVLPIT
jgi:hypothetical protein